MISRNNKILTTLILLASFAINSAIASNSDKVDQANKLVTNLTSEIIKTTSNKSLSENVKRDQVFKEIDKVIDAEWIAKFTLGKNYKNLDNNQQKKFIDLYHQYVVKTYGPKLKNYGNLKFKILQTIEQGKFIVVKTEFEPQNSPKVFIDFKLKDKGQNLVIIDFIAEGVSFIETQRSEFSSIVSDKGIAELFKILEQRIANLDKSPNKSLAK